jgi:TPR repeat protein
MSSDDGTDTLDWDATYAAEGAQDGGGGERDYGEEVYDDGFLGADVMDFHLGGGDHAEVWAYYNTMAHLGSTAAKVALGNMHLHGWYGAEVNEQKAAEFFEQAARDGDPEGMGE